MPFQEIVPVVIALNASLSGAVEIGDAKQIAISMPADWTAANLTFQGSYDGATWWDVYDDAGTEVNVTAAEDRLIVLGTITKNLRPLRFLKVRSGTAGSAVTQGAARTLHLILAR